MFKAKYLTALMTATALSTIVALPASAQSVDDLKKQLQALSKRIEQLEQTQAQKMNVPVVKKAEPAFSLGTEDGLFEFNIRGRIYTDAGWASDKDNTMDIDATEFRTARLGVEGKAWKTVKYEMEVDFAGDKVTVKDAYLEYASELGKWKFGQFKTPNSLEEQTSSRHTTFMERASFTDAFGLARMIGIGYGKRGDNWTFNAGVFRGSNSTKSANEGHVFASRVTYGDTFDGGSWMLGGSARFRSVGDALDLRYRQRPHNHLSDRFIATDRIAKKDAMYALEAAAQFGSFHVASEWATLSAKDGGTRDRNATFSGGYVEAGWFITGEKKPLKLSKGAWGRPKVNNPVHDGGIGAWQIAAKYDVIDLTDNGVFGGEQETLILGVNWYLNRHTRFMVNYSHSSIEEAFNVSANGEDGENSVNALGARFQVDW